MSKRFPLDLTSRGVNKLTDKILIHNIDTGVTEYTTVLELLTAIGLSGVRFPAVQIPSADVNTLDDYEEGIWTPTLEFGGASVGITYSVQQGVYTKIGNMVFFNIRIQLTSKGVSVGDALIQGLPFVVGASPAVSISFDKITFADMVIAVASSSAIYLREITNAGNRTSLTDADFADDSVMNISGFYRI